MCIGSAFFINKLLAHAANYKIVLIMNSIKICIIYHLREHDFMRITEVEIRNVHDV